MLDIFVREALATRALCQSHALAERFVICFAVCCIQCAHWIAALDTYWHGGLSCGLAKVVSLGEIREGPGSRAGRAWR